jgi:hypothetical protein
MRGMVLLWLMTIRKAMRNGGLSRLIDVDFSPVFLCGISGSGTTLLGGLLDQDYVSELCIHVSDRLRETDRSLWMEHSTYYDDLAEYYRDLIRPLKYSRRKIKQAVLGLYRRLSVYPRNSPFVLDKAPNSHMVRIGILRSAFPKSKIILIYRNPIEVIEGLRRKWEKPFGQASLEDLCAFWNNLHEKFLVESEKFYDDLFVLSYGQLTANPESWTEEIATWLGLQKRTNSLQYEDLPNSPGKGLRNIVGGKIKVIKNAFVEVKSTVSKSEREFIESRTRDTVKKLKERSRVKNYQHNSFSKMLRESS